MRPPSVGAGGGVGGDGVVGAAGSIGSHATRAQRVVRDARRLHALARRVARRAGASHAEGGGVEVGDLLGVGIAVAAGHAGGVVDHLGQIRRRRLAVVGEAEQPVVCAVCAQRIDQLVDAVRHAEVAGSARADDRRHRVGVLRAVAAPVAEDGILRRAEVGAAVDLRAFGRGDDSRAARAPGSVKDVDAGVDDRDVGAALIVGAVGRAGAGGVGGAGGGAAGRVPGGRAVYDACGQRLLPRRGLDRVDSVDRARLRDRTLWQADDDRVGRRGMTFDPPADLAQLGDHRPLAAGHRVGRRGRRSRRSPARARAPSA